MRVRVPLCPLATDTDRLLQAVTLIRERLGNVPVFVGGRETPVYDYDSGDGLDPAGTDGSDAVPQLCVVLTLPDPPMLARHLQLQRYDTPWPSSAPDITKGDAAVRMVRAHKDLGTPPPPEVAALAAAYQAASDAWNAARWRDEEDRPRVERQVEDHFREQVDARIGDLRGKLHQLLDDYSVERALVVDQDDCRDHTLLALGWLPDPVS